MIKVSKINVSYQKPKFETYQASEEFRVFLNGTENVDYVFVNFIEDEISFALRKVFINDHLFDLVTSIHFQTRISDISLLNALSDLKSELLLSGCVCCYIQTKSSIVVDNDLSVNSELFRTNYYFDLTISDLLSPQSRDAKQRLKKILKQQHEILINSGSIEDFYNNYFRISDNRNFSDKYLYSKDDFEKLLNNPNFDFIQVRGINGEYWAGGIFACSNKDVDYLYGSDSIIVNDAIRLLVYSAAKYYETKGKKRLYLGGGVIENDSLAVFKSRMATVPQKCTAIRMVVNREEAEKIVGKELNADWYNEFFPPYRK